VPNHPAKFSAELMSVFKELIDAEVENRYDGETPLLILDPFAGTGKIHDLAAMCDDVTTIGIEIEPEWAAMHPNTYRGDALDLSHAWTDMFDIVLTSPTYGNRMADHHDAKDDSKRMTYRHQLGRPLSPNNSGQLQWGKKYQEFHMLAWCEVHRVLRPGGLFILNTKDHIRQGDVVEVTAWHRITIMGMGFDWIGDTEVKVPSMKFGANHELRLDSEYINCFRKRVL
jgi:hypothetical protein